MESVWRQRPKQAFFCYKIKQVAGPVRGECLPVGARLGRRAPNPGAVGNGPGDAVFGGFYVSLQKYKENERSKNTYRVLLSAVGGL